ncbi:MAG: DnaJ C-terminal domain-containing protein [Gemmataceae bacterium]
MKIPAGIDDGKKLRVKGDDHRPRDVLLKVKIQLHPPASAGRNDILLDVPISVAKRSLAGRWKCPRSAASGWVEVRPGTSSGSRLRLRGKGINGGDQYLVFKVLVPHKARSMKRAAN